MSKTIKMNKPIIGITANILTVEQAPFSGLERSYVNHPYISSITLGGGVPFLLPIITDEESIYRQVQLMDGIVLSGGYDVSPLLYNEEPHQKLEAVCVKRDTYEYKVIKIAYELKKPILGICRGLQLLNVVFGGTLYQDISLHEPATTIQHRQQSTICEVAHRIHIEPTSRLHQVFGKTSLLVNSSHHQMIKTLASNFTVTARAKDGMIEAIEGKEDVFVLGVQWHPEAMIEEFPEMLKLFEFFVAEAKAN